jgi:hypothetical protein
LRDEIYRKGHGSKPRVAGARLRGARPGVARNASPLPPPWWGTRFDRGFGDRREGYGFARFVRLDVVECDLDL